MCERTIRNKVMTRNTSYSSRFSNCYLIVMLIGTEQEEDCQFFKLGHLKKLTDMKYATTTILISVVTTLLPLATKHMELGRPLPGARAHLGCFVSVA